MFYVTAMRGGTGCVCLVVFVDVDVVAWLGHWDYSSAFLSPDGLMGYGGIMRLGSLVQEAIRGAFCTICLFPSLPCTTCVLLLSLADYHGHVVFLNHELFLVNNFSYG